MRFGRIDSNAQNTHHKCIELCWMFKIALFASLDLVWMVPKKKKMQPTHVSLSLSLSAQTKHAKNQSVTESNDFQFRAAYL